jgi:hypothetical protein
MFRMIYILCFFLLHPVHVSFTSIEYVREKDSFTVFMRLYFDDFMADSKLAGEITLTGDKLEKNPVTPEYMQKYLSEKFTLKVNGEVLRGKLIDFNKADNEIIMNMEFKGAKKPETVTVKSLIMTDIYKDQSNMIILKINEFEEGIKLTSDILEKTVVVK